jgi:hypothetical protein
MPLPAPRLVRGPKTVTQGLRRGEGEPPGTDRPATVGCDHDQHSFIQAAVKQGGTEHKPPQDTLGEEPPAASGRANFTAAAVA